MGLIYLYIIINQAQVPFLSRDTEFSPVDITVGYTTVTVFIEIFRIFFLNVYAEMKYKFWNVDLITPEVCTAGITQGLKHW